MGRHRLLIGLLAVLVLVLALGALAARVFIWPVTNAPAHVGAIVALGGVPGGEQRAAGLARAGYAPILAVSQVDEPCPAAIPGVRIICFRPRPLTTQGEARFMGALARRRHLRSMMVISVTAQASVARLRFERCFSGRLLVVAIRPTSRSQWMEQLRHEAGSLGEALVLQRSC